jgi:hypothetical protein
MVHSRAAAWAVIAGIVIAGASGCGSGLGDAGGPASSTVQSAPPAPAPSTSAPPCATRACIISDMNSDLVGLTAKDDTVSIKAACRASTEKDDGHGIYAAKCTVTYSDGSTAAGTGTVDLTSSQVSFSPSL